MRAGIEPLRADRKSIPGNVAPPVAAEDLSNQVAVIGQFPRLAAVGDIIRARRLRGGRCGRTSMSTSSRTTGTAPALDDRKPVVKYAVFENGGTISTRCASQGLSAGLRWYASVA